MVSDADLVELKLISRRVEARQIRHAVTMLDYLMLTVREFHVNRHSRLANRNCGFSSVSEESLLTCTRRQSKKRALVRPCPIALGILGATAILAEEKLDLMFFVLCECVPSHDVSPNQRRAADSHSRARRAIKHVILS